jgi:nitrite reductase (NADH) small subunit
MSGQAKWVDVCRLDDIPVRGARLVKTAHGCIAMFRTSASEVYAIDDTCPHKGGPLAQGIVHDKSVTCPLHNWVISLETGEAQGADKGRVRTYALTLKDGRILLDVSKLKAARAA